MRHRTNKNAGSVTPEPASGVARVRNCQITRKYTPPACRVSSPAFERQRRTRMSRKSFARKYTKRHEDSSTSTRVRGLASSRVRGFGGSGEPVVLRGNGADPSEAAAQTLEAPARQVALLMTPRRSTLARGVLARKPEFSGTSDRDGLHWGSSRAALAGRPAPRAGRRNSENCTDVAFREPWVTWGCRFAQRAIERIDAR
jgi:hypothetical protein